MQPSQAPEHVVSRQICPKTVFTGHIQCLIAAEPDQRAVNSSPSLCLAMANRLFPTVTVMVSSHGYNIQFPGGKLLKTRVIGCTPPTQYITRESYNGHPRDGELVALVAITEHFQSPRQSLSALEMPLGQSSG